MGQDTASREVADYIVRSEEVEVAVRECLRMQESCFYRDGIFKLIRRWSGCVNVMGSCVEK